MKRLAWPGAPMTVSPIGNQIEAVAMRCEALKILEAERALDRTTSSLFARDRAAMESALTTLRWVALFGLPAPTEALAQATGIADMSEGERTRDCAETLVESARAMGLAYGLSRDDGALTALALAYTIALAQSAGPLVDRNKRVMIITIAQRLLRDSFEAVWKTYVVPATEAVH